MLVSGELGLIFCEYRFCYNIIYWSGIDGFVEVVGVFMFFLELLEHIVCGGLKIWMFVGL